MLRKLCVFVPLFVLTLPSFSQESRHFTFYYAFTVKNVPEGKRVRVWIPAAQSDAFQDVKVVSAKGDLPLKKTRESKYGDEIYFAEVSKAAGPELHFDVEYDVARPERIALRPQPRVAPVPFRKKERKEESPPHKYPPNSGIPADLAVKVTQILN